MPVRGCTGTTVDTVLTGLCTRTHMYTLLLSGKVDTVPIFQRIVAQVCTLPYICLCRLISVRALILLLLSVSIQPRSFSIELVRVPQKKAPCGPGNSPVIHSLPNLLLYRRRESWQNVNFKQVLYRPDARPVA